MPESAWVLLELREQCRLAADVVPACGGPKQQEQQQQLWHAESHQVIRVGTFPCYQINETTQCKLFGRFASESISVLSGFDPPFSTHRQKGGRKVALML